MRLSLPLSLLLLIFSGFCGPAHAAPKTPAEPKKETVFIEDMTSPELKAHIQQGYTTVLIPSGGSEQNGPHIAIGKHNWIMQHNAQAIAEALGHTLVAPVIGFVPEGSINPPQGHMLFAGTISVRDDVFAGILEDVARSMKQAGFTVICFLGDSGGNQSPQRLVANKLSQEWGAEGITVLNVTDYYATKAADEWAASHKLGHGDPAGHAGFMDTSEMLAVHPSGVRKELVKTYDAKDAPATGVVGNPAGATAEYGKTLLHLRINAAVAQIRAAIQPPVKK